MNIVIWLIISIIGGVLGRLGGWDKGNRLFRLLGVPACCIGLIVCIGGFKMNWLFLGALAISFGAILGTTSTYFKKKGAPVTWINWLFYGFMEGVALLPYALYAHDWIGWGIRTLVCSGLVCLWDTLIGWDVLEEFGRYFIIVATIPLLFLFIH